MTRYSTSPLPSGKLLDNPIPERFKGRPLDILHESRVFSHIDSAIPGYATRLAAVYQTTGADSVQFRSASQSGGRKSHPKRRTAPGFGGADRSRKARQMPSVFRIKLVLGRS